MKTFPFLRHKFRFLRRILSRVLGGIVLPIRAGPLQGKRWLVATNLKFLRGTYEPHQTQLFREVVTAGDVVYDVGAHVGYYTVLASILVGEGGRVVCFEPLPVNLHDLRRHLQMNGCDNVTVVEACVADRSGVCRLETRTGTGTGHISESGGLTVPMVSLDALASEEALPVPNCMKIDVEGAEYLVLQGAQSVIASAQPMIFLSLHGDELRKKCVEFLRERGYELRPIVGAQLSEATEILAIGKK